MKKAAVKKPVAADPASTARALRSAEHTLLRVARRRIETTTKRAYQVAARQVAALAKSLEHAHA